MINPSKNLAVTAVSHPDTGQITAFFNDLPGLLVQGNSDKDVKDKLTSLLESFIKQLDSKKNNIEIQLKSI